MKKLLPLIISICTFFMSCTSAEEKSEARKDKYEDSKLSLEEIEKKTPTDFLSVAGTDKKNVLGQTVVRGKIHNKAKMVSFKDVDVKLKFYSKTGTLLQEDQETIYETIAPGATVSFKSKYFSPKGTDSIALSVLSARF